MALVTIGIPTYRRPQLLRRAVTSALAQDHLDLEVLVADNASGDETSSICHALAATDPRLRYIPQPTNVGPAANFMTVLTQATGEYFMWLGDDDWLDSGYVSETLRILSSSPDIAIVGGVARNYRRGIFENESRQRDLTHPAPSQRVTDYYRSLGNNAIFYGLMRRAMLMSCVVTNTLGGDWLLMAQVAFQGKMLTNPGVAIHRERAISPARNVTKLVKMLGAPRMQSILPITSVAIAAARDVVRSDAVYGRMEPAERRKLARDVQRIVMIRLGVWIRCQTVIVSIIGRPRAARWQTWFNRALRR